LDRAGFEFRKGRRIAFGNCPVMALTAGRGRRCAGNVRGNLHHVFEKKGAIPQADLVKLIAGLRTPSPKWGTHHQKRLTSIDRWRRPGGISYTFRMLASRQHDAIGLGRSGDARLLRRTRVLADHVGAIWRGDFYRTPLSTRRDRHPRRDTNRTSRRVIDRRIAVVRSATCWRRPSRSLIRAKNAATVMLSARGPRTPGRHAQ
jgi:hypothetical protein